MKKMIGIFMESILINDFFQNNYQELISRTKKFLKANDYFNYPAEELIAEYLIFIQSNENRINTYERLIRNGRVLLYMSKTIYTTTVAHNKFRDDCKYKVDILNPDKTYDDVGEPYEEPFEELFEEPLEEVKDSITYDELIQKSEELSCEEGNWYMYELWKDHYLEGMTYKELSKKYLLTTSPLWESVNKFNNLIKKNLS